MLWKPRRGAYWFFFLFSACAYIYRIEMSHLYSREVSAQSRADMLYRVIFCFFHCRYSMSTIYSQKIITRNVERLKEFLRQRFRFDRRSTRFATSDWNSYWWWPDEAILQEFFFSVPSCMISRNFDFLFYWFLSPDSRQKVVENAVPWLCEKRRKPKRDLPHHLGHPLIALY